MRRKLILLLVLVTQPFYIWFVVKQHRHEYHLQQAMEHFKKAQELIKQADQGRTNPADMEVLFGKAHEEWQLGENEILIATNK